MTCLKPKIRSKIGLPRLLKFHNFLTFILSVFSILIYFKPPQEVLGDDNHLALVTLPNSIKRLRFQGAV